MVKNFRLNLTLILIAFSITIAFSVAIINQTKIMEKLKDDHQSKLELIDGIVLNSLRTLDNAYGLFDEDLTNKMRNHSDYLVNYYERYPDVTTWDYAALKNELGMDVYVIDEENTIIHSSLDEDIGLNFNECCEDFSKLLTERRLGSEFVDDGMDIQQKSGEIKKFSYIPTRDHKYILELGLSLKETEIFQQFNFIETIEELEANHNEIHAIHIYNVDGFILGEELRHARRSSITEEHRPLLKKALSTGEMVEKEGKWNGAEAVYRYIPYSASTERGLSTTRIIEVVCNKSELKQTLQKYRQDFFQHLALVLILAIALAFLIARWLAMPMYLAFHDSLTGLRNRAAFEEALRGLLRKKYTPALMMIDLDYFKRINDQYGHDKGDELLKETASIITSTVGKGSIPARLGGDEFIVIFPVATESMLEDMAVNFANRMKELTLCDECGVHIPITASIGIAICEENDDVESLYKKVDIALYESKRNGRNQHQVYQSHCS